MEQAKINKTIQQMINFDDVTKENIKEHNPNWPKIPDHPKNINNWRLWIWKGNSLFNLINEELDIDKIDYMLKIRMKQNINF